jgi:hypothetical protein
MWSMRYLWPAATFILLVVAGVLYLGGQPGCELASGNALYLNRQEVETMRARFCYASDCRLIAEQMSKVERARWYCR